MLIRTPWQQTRTAMHKVLWQPTLVVVVTYWLEQVGGLVKAMGSGQEARIHPDASVRNQYSVYILLKAMSISEFMWGTYT